MREPAARWDHEEGVPVIQTPPVDCLMFVSGGIPGHPKVIMLSGETAPTVESDRDRAVLRAFLTLALQRLDTQEHTPDAHP